MMFRYRQSLQAIAIALLLGTIASANEPPTLKSNPFARPPSAAITPIQSELRHDGDPSGLELRATMVGSGGNLANVAGRTLRPGDDYQGYTLVRVFEDRAVFARQGRRVTVYVKPDLEDDNED